MTYISALCNNHEIIVYGDSRTTVNNEGSKSYINDTEKVWVQNRAVLAIAGSNEVNGIFTTDWVKSIIKKKTKNYNIPSILLTASKSINQDITIIISFFRDKIPYIYVLETKQSTLSLKFTSSGGFWRGNSISQEIAYAMNKNVQFDIMNSKRLEFIAKSTMTAILNASSYNSDQSVGPPVTYIRIDNLNNTTNL